MDSFERDDKLIIRLWNFLTVPVRYAVGLHQKNLRLFLDRLDERLRLHLAKELKRVLEIVPIHHR